MTKNKIKFFVVFLMLVDLIFVFITGYARRGSTNLHVALSWIFVILVVIHLALSFNWLKAILKNWREI